MTEASFLQLARQAYDVLAVEHTDLVRWDPTLASLPVDRALLGVFAELVRAAGDVPVIDVGCGSGRITRILADFGLDVFGVDLSPEMVSLARRLYPDLRFCTGSMLALEVGDQSLGGVLAYYSIIHVPWEHRPSVFREFHRVLAPGGVLMLAFQIGDEIRRHDEIDGAKIPPWIAYRQQPDEVVELLAAAGFDMLARVVREPEHGVEAVAQGYLLARRAFWRGY
jgi:ubiquinone/menaquinone biosynthesis C-methylase UbiE